MSESIPKRIIQTDKSADLPLFAQASVANIRLLNPDYEYLFFDDAQVEEFINSEFPQYMQVFRSFPVRIQRYDFFRYLAVYRLGGFYFDTDVLLATNLADLLGFTCVFPFEELTVNRMLRQEYGMDWEAGNYAFGAAPGHPFLGAIIDNCVRATRDTNWARAILRSIPRVFRDEFVVYYTTGPGLVSRTLAEYPDARTQVKVLFPGDVCDPSCWHRFGNFGVHAMAGRWRKKKSMLYRRLFAAWMAWERKKQNDESRKLGTTRTLDFGR